MTTTAAGTYDRTVREENDVLLDEVADQQWRVLDARLPKDDVRALLGFVTVVQGRFEVMRMSTPAKSTYCPDLPAVRNVFAGEKHSWLRGRWAQRVSSLLAA